MSQHFPCSLRANDEIISNKFTQTARPHPASDLALYLNKELITLQCWLVDATHMCRACIFWTKQKKPFYTVHLWRQFFQGYFSFMLRISLKLKCTLSLTIWKQAKQEVILRIENCLRCVKSTANLKIEINDFQALIGPGLIFCWFTWSRWCNSSRKRAPVYFSKIHRSVLRKITIDLLHFWDVYTSICEKKVSAQKYGLFMQNKYLYIISLF